MKSLISDHIRGNQEGVSPTDPLMPDQRAQANEHSVGQRTRGSNLKSAQESVKASTSDDQAYSPQTSANDRSSRHQVYIGPSSLCSILTLAGVSARSTDTTCYSHHVQDLGTKWLEDLS
jgi:hypothetical protein